MPGDIGCSQCGKQIPNDVLYELNDAGNPICPECAKKNAAKEQNN